MNNVIYSTLLLIDTVFKQGYDKIAFSYDQVVDFIKSIDLNYSEFIKIAFMYKDWINCVYCFIVCIFIREYYNRLKNNVTKTMTQIHRALCKEVTEIDTVFDGVYDNIDNLDKKMDLHKSIQEVTLHSLQSICNSQFQEIDKTMEEIHKTMENTDKKQGNQLNSLMNQLDSLQMVCQKEFVLADNKVNLLDKKLTEEKEQKGKMGLKMEYLEKKCEQWENQMVSQPNLCDLFIVQKKEKIIHNIKKYYQWIHSLQSWRQLTDDGRTLEGRLSDSQDTTYRTWVVSNIKGLCEKKIGLYPSTKGIMTAYFEECNYEGVFTQIQWSNSTQAFRFGKDVKYTVDYNKIYALQNVYTGSGYRREIIEPPLPSYEYFDYLLSVQRIDETQDEFELRFLQHLLSVCQHAYTRYLPYKITCEYDNLHDRTLRELHTETTYKNPYTPQIEW
jgi:hypothetical protein